MTNKELLRAIIAEIDLIMHDKDYRFPESENTWYSRESCKVLTPEEVFEELRTELLQLNNESNKEIAELQKQLAEKEKEIEKLREWLSQCEANRKFEQEKKNLVFKELTERSEQLKSQPAEIVEKIRKELGLKLKYKLNDEVSVLKICNQINEVLDTTLKEYQK